MGDISELKKVRLEKEEKLKELGISVHPERYEVTHTLKDARNLESLGNKAILEKRINIRASDYKFADKQKYYQGYTNKRNQIKEGTKAQELLNMASIYRDFEEKDIISRRKNIIDTFIRFLDTNHLIK